jgi:hypothetical protein
VNTLATDLAEPSAAFVDRETLVVVESAAHRLTAIPLLQKYLDVEAREYATSRPATDVAAGAFELRIAFTPPTGQHFDDRYGPSTRLVVESTPPALLATGSGTGTELARHLAIAEGVTSGVLHVTVSAATCDDDSEHAACHLHQQDWGIPVRVTRGGTDHLELMLRGVAQ